ncbi:hypothetical protein MAR_004517 [Mya arenaria]|uniref:Thyroglobulin type-1 domain-containing protein n=1 Tax=Mya arenaria TaxID=6604 RepID=A0ABY7EZY5_MYAAR|nr:hypothetical protein MAR_004517 [Mya arenaria]
MAEVDATLMSPSKLETLPFDVSSAPSTDTPVDGVSCKSQADCPLNQCCVHNPLNKPDSRKRFLFDHYNEHDHGFCRIARNLNQSCWPIGRDPANGELYEFFCPCTSGLEYRGLIVHESAHQIVHERPMCQSPESNLIDSVTYSGQVCSADGDFLAACAAYSTQTTGDSSPQGTAETSNNSTIPAL